MLLLEVHSFHSTSQMQHHLLRRWLPIRAGMKNVFNLAREEEVCINSKRQTC
jgi:hypothetical protein